MLATPMQDAARSRRRSFGRTVEMQTLRNLTTILDHQLGVTQLLSSGTDRATDAVSTQCHPPPADVEARICRGERGAQPEFVQSIGECVSVVHRSPPEFAPHHHLDGNQAPKG